MKIQIKKLIFLPTLIKIYKLQNKLVFNLNKQFILISIPNDINIKRQGIFLIIEFPIGNINNNTWYILVKNIINGLTRNFIQRLQLKGVGFKAALTKLDNIELKIGYSHIINHQILFGTNVEISKNVLIQIKSPLKNLVGQEAVNIQKFRFPDIYKGKGIVYKGEKLILKIGKKA